jgi:hypothetical protein
MPCSEFHLFFFVFILSFTLKRTHPSEKKRKSVYVIFLEEGKRRVCRGPFKAKILHSSSSLKKKKS